MTDPPGLCQGPALPVQPIDGQQLLAASSTSPLALESFLPHASMNVVPTFTPFSLLQVKAWREPFLPCASQSVFPHAVSLPALPPRECSHRDHKAIQLYQNSWEIFSLHCTSLLTTFDRVDTVPPKKTLRPVPSRPQPSCFSSAQSPCSVSVAVHPGGNPLLYQQPTCRKVHVRAAPGGPSAGIVLRCL